MPRYYRRRYYGRKSKYSNETFQETGVFTNQNLVNTGDFYQTPWLTVVPFTNVGGVRKVKNFSVRLGICGNTNDGGLINIPYTYLLVYVPEKQNPGAVQTETGTLYEPNQNVIISGVGVTGQEVKSFNRLARNLNSGDSIQMIIVFNVGGTLEGGDTIRVNLQTNYAITY